MSSEFLAMRFRRRRLRPALLRPLAARRTVAGHAFVELALAEIGDVVRDHPARHFEPPAEARSRMSTLLTPFWKLMTVAPRRRVRRSRRRLGSIAALDAQRDDLRFLQRFGTAAIIDVARAIVLASRIVAERQAMFVDSLDISRRPMKVTGKPAAAQAPPMKQPTEPAPRIATFGPPRCLPLPRYGCTPWSGSHSLRAARRTARRRRSACRRADTNSRRCAAIAASSRRQPLADADGHVLVEAAMIAERAEEQLEALALDDGLARAHSRSRDARNRAGR